MTENDGSPAWLLPLIVVILVASVVLLFFASRPGTGDLISTGASGDFQEGPRFRLSQSNPPTDRVDPCSLIDQSEIEDVLGSSVSAPEYEDLDNPIGEQRCVFFAPDKPEEQVIVIDIVFQQSMEPVLTQNGYDVIELYRGRKVQDRQIEDIAGIDDDAFWGGTGSELWSGLHVRSADVYLRVLVNSDNDDEAFENAREIAVLILNRIFDQ